MGHSFDWCGRALLMWQYQPWASGLDCCHKAAWASCRNEPVGSTPLWFLLQLLPSGSFSIRVPTLTSLKMDCAVELEAETNTFLPHLLLLVFHHSSGVAETRGSHPQYLVEGRCHEHWPSGLYYSFYELEFLWILISTYGKLKVHIYLHIYGLYLGATSSSLGI